jgi:hypothetical protein
MREADHGLIGHGPHPVTWERLIRNAEHNRDICFKAIECRKPPEDQGVSMEDTYIGSAIVIWNQSNVAALRQVNWASVPMEVSRRLLQWLFRDLPKGNHVDLVFETQEVREAVKACADIIVQGSDSKIYCQLESWR